jgi:hypothetical protein
VSAFVEFTRRDGSAESMALHISQIKAIEQQVNTDCAKIILNEPIEGNSYYFTIEPYKVIRDRLLQAQNPPRAGLA